MSYDPKGSDIFVKLVKAIWYDETLTDFVIQCIKEIRDRWSCLDFMSSSPLFLVACIAKLAMNISENNCLTVLAQVDRQPVRTGRSYFICAILCEFRMGMCQGILSDELNTRLGCCKSWCLAAFFSQDLLTKIKIVPHARY